jgi:hypothetical protein
MFHRWRERRVVVQRLGEVFSCITGQHNFLQATPARTVVANLIIPFIVEKSLAFVAFTATLEGRDGAICWQYSIFLCVPQELAH